MLAFDENQREPWLANSQPRDRQHRRAHRRVNGGKPAARLPDSGKATVWGHQLHGEPTQPIVRPDPPARLPIPHLQCAYCGSVLRWSRAFASWKPVDDTEDPKCSQRRFLGVRLDHTTVRVAPDITSPWVPVLAGLVLLVVTIGGLLWAWL